MEIFDDDEWFIQGSCIWRASRTKHPMDGWSSISCSWDSMLGKSKCRHDEWSVLWSLRDKAVLSQKIDFLESPPLIQSDHSKFKELLSRYAGPQPVRVFGKELNAFIAELQNAISI